MKAARAILVLLPLLTLAQADGLTRFAPTTEEVRASYQRADRLAAEIRSRVFMTSLTPNWMGDSFWYRKDSRDGRREFILVDAAAATRGPAFDHERLAAAFS